MLGDENYKLLYKLVVDELFIGQHVHAQTIVDAVRHIFANLRELPLPADKAK